MMQYYTKTGGSGCFNCDSRMVASKAQELASNFFAVYTEETSFSICIFDFEERTHEILEYTIERNITVSRY